MLSLRPLLDSDHEQLHRWLQLAAWTAPTAAQPDMAHHHEPAVVESCSDWGSPFDLGLVARLASRDVGACWLRLLPEDVGLGYVDIFTPQLGMALEPAFRQRGYGRQMLSALLHQAACRGYAQVSLSVHPDNPALRFYQQAGFNTVTLRQYCHVMVTKLF